MGSTACFRGRVCDWRVAGYDRGCDCPAVGECSERAELWRLCVLSWTRRWVRDGRGRGCRRGYRRRRCWREGEGVERDAVEWVVAWCAWCGEQQQQQREREFVPDVNGGVPSWRA